MSEFNKDVQSSSGWKPNLNGAIPCPWASNAPISATTSCKTSGKCSENCHVPPRYFNDQFQMNSNSKINPLFSRSKPTITYFNNFVRLMQLFPEMHPASLHTAMSLCKNDFISTVDRLLYVRRYRNGAFYRKENSVSNVNKKIHKRVPHVCNGVSRNVNYSFNEEIKLTPNRQQTMVDTSEGDYEVLLPNRTFEVKRLVYNNKAKVRCSKTDTELITNVEKVQQRPLEVSSEENRTIAVQDLSQAKLTTCS